MGPDLTDPKWMYLKAIGFLLIATICAAALMARSFRVDTLVLILLLAWSSARLYYFCFYVIERYIDPQFKFAGVGSAVVHLLRNRSVKDRDL